MYELGTTGLLLTKVLRMLMQTNEMYSLYLIIYFIIIIIHLISIFIIIFELLIELLFSRHSFEIMNKLYLNKGNFIIFFIKNGT